MATPLQNTLIDIQFSGPDEQKLRRLAQEIATLQRALNNLINEVNDLAQQGTETVVAAHALTGDRHTVSGLTAGQVLAASSATAVGFRALHLEDLFKTDGETFINAQEGDVLTMHNGYFSMLAPGAGGEDSIELE